MWLALVCLLSFSLLKPVDISDNLITLDSLLFKLFNSLELATTSDMHNLFTMFSEDARQYILKFLSNRQNKVKIGISLKRLRTTD